MVSIILYLSAENALLFTAILFTIVAIIRIRKLYTETKPHHHSSPDSLLLSITLAGVISFDIFFMIDSIAGETDGWITILRIARSLLDAIQSILQVSLILIGSKKAAKTRESLNDKPGRGAIMCLLIINLVLWGFKTMLGKNLMTLKEFYQLFDAKKFSSVVNVCAPLIIFYRFHSSACFSEIWKQAYRQKKEK